MTSLPGDEEVIVDQEATAEEESSEKKKKLVSDIESGNIEAGHGAEGDYAISKNVAEDEENNEDVVDEAPLEVDSSDDSLPEIEEVDNVEDFTKPTDSIPEKKISVSIEHLRKKMEEELEEEFSPEEILEETIEEGAEEKKKQLASDIASGNVASGEGGDGDYAISKKVVEEEGEDDIDEFSPVVEDIEDFSPEVEDVNDVEEFAKPTDSIPEKKISVSIEHLRKKMSDDKDN